MNPLDILKSIGSHIGVNSSVPKAPNIQPTFHFAPNLQTPGKTSFHFVGGYTPSQMSVPTIPIQGANRNSVVVQPKSVQNAQAARNGSVNINLPATPRDQDSTPQRTMI